MKRIAFILILALATVTAAAQVHVTTDKSCYVAGDRIWCSVFSASGPAVAYLELISSDGVAARARIALDEGRGGGSLLIPPATPTGNYRLLAYTAGVEPSGPVLSVFNTLGTARVKGGVEIDGEGVSPAPAGNIQTGYGFSVSSDGALELRNSSGAAVSFCVSLYREDSLPEPAHHSISGFTPGPAGPRSDGEVLRAVLAGEDAEALRIASEDVFDRLHALIAAPGSGADCYASEMEEDGSFLFSTDNIYGQCDVVCMLDELFPDKDCHLELVSPFVSPGQKDIPALRLYRSCASDLERRTAAMLRRVASDTLAVSLPMRCRHFMLPNERYEYILDDYNRFPTMEEVFTEITPNVKMRVRKGVTYVYVLHELPVTESVPRWGHALTMIDGVPVIDQTLIRTYDPAIVKTVEAYPYRFDFGGKTYDGVVNLVTFKGNMPGVLFDDNVRIYSFDGCALPEEHRGEETLYWHPLLKLAPGEGVVIPSEGLEAGVRYTLCAEGLTDGGSPVYLRKTFVR